MMFTAKNAFLQIWPLAKLKTKVLQLSKVGQFIKWLQ